jgi:hypothetical protein
MVQVHLVQIPGILVRREENAHPVNGRKNSFFLQPFLTDRYERIIRC